MEMPDSDCISLETFRRDGAGVRTPVWFVSHGGTIYIVTRERTGKVGRLARNPRVNLAPCSFRGGITGEWISGTARITSGGEADRIVELRNKKYGLRARLAGLVTRSKGNVVVYAVTPD